MKAAVAITAILLAASAGARVNREYRREVVGKRTLATSAGHAVYGQIRNSPHEWGRGPVGFAKRVGSTVAQHAVKETIQFGVAAARHENLHYRRSNLQGKWPRLKYAVKSTFIVPKTNKPGKKTLALSRISGNMGAGLISRAWQPASAAGLGAGLASGGIGIGADVGVNVAREFWPQKHHRVTHAHLVRRNHGV